MDKEYLIYKLSDDVTASCELLSGRWCATVREHETKICELGLISNTNKRNERIRNSRAPETALSQRA